MGVNWGLKRVKNCLLSYKKCIVFVILPVCNDLFIFSDSEIHFHDIEIFRLFLG